MNFNKYHVSRNLLFEKYENRSINGFGAFTIDNDYDLWLGEVVAGQTYTISNMDYVYGFFAAKPMPNTGITYDGSRGYEASGTVVVTVPSGCTWVAVRVLHNANNAMLNTGSTPLPYEPYSSEVWHDTPHYIHNTSTDTITTLPAVVYPNATTATVGLKGQAVQSSVPSPTSPVMPDGCGNKTANLFDDDNAEFGKWVNSDGSITTNATYAAGYNIEVGTSSIFAVKYYGNKPYSYSMAFYDSNGNFLSRIHKRNPSDSYDTFPVPENSVSAIFQVAVSTGIVMTSAILKAMKLMLNTGSTALPYEPYGVKIPISSAGQTNNIYFGEVETTRKIKKLVLTGEETSWVTLDPYYTVSADNVRPWNGCICTHCAYNGIIGGNSNTRLWIKQTSFPDYQTLEDFKSYLQQQYAAGTPVTIWYVLGAETTGIVNEPLMRIGDYADTLSNVSISVTAGGDTISVDTTVQPSEVTVNYKGWHPVQNVHEFVGNYTVGTMQALTIAQLQTHTISDLQEGEWL